MVNYIKLPEEEKGPYEVSDDVEHPCCHSSMVIDTRGEEDFPGTPKRICECFEPEEAIRIATALNQLEKNNVNR